MEETIQATIQSPIAGTSKRSWILFASAGMIILLVGVGVGLVAGRYTYTPKPAPIPVVSVSPTPIQNPMANWKTYINKPGNYSIGYPSDWVVRPIAAGAGNVTISPDTNGVDLFDPNGTSAGYPDKVITIQTFGIMPQSEQTSQKQTVNVAGVQAIKIDDVLPEGHGIPTTLNSTTYEILIPGKTGVVEILMRRTPNDNQTQAIFDQILSTFKFVDQTSVIDTSGWKMYTNPQYNFSFEHPNLDDLTNTIGIAGPQEITDLKPIVQFADKSTITAPGSGAAFDGFAVYVVPNSQKRTLSQYVESQKQALTTMFKVFRGSDYSDQTQESFLKVGNQQAVLLANTGDRVERVYVSFPNNQQFLVVGKVQVNDSFKDTFDKILSTFEFAR